MDTLFNYFSTSDYIWVSLIIIGVTLLTTIMFNSIISIKFRGTKSFYLTSILMPVIVSSIIAMISIFLNSSDPTTNIARIATFAVALGLIRFRSINGTAEDLLILFAGIGIGFIAGLGYVVYSSIFAIGFALIYLGLSSLKLFDGKRFTGEKLLKVTIPESLQYDEVFNDTFSHYLKKSELVEIKTTGMGSLYRLSYCIEFKNVKEQKEFIDELRVKNGNLEISILPYVGNIKTL